MFGTIQDENWELCQISSFSANPKQLGENPSAKDGFANKRTLRLLMKKFGDQVGRECLPKIMSVKM